MKLAIHTIRFSKDYFLSYETCIAWLAENGLRNLGYDEVESSYIFKQVSKDKFNESSLQEIKLGSGVVGVIGLVTNNDNTLENVTDADTIIPTEQDNDVEDEIASDAERKSKLLAVLSSAFEAMKDFIAQDEPTPVTTSVVVKSQEPKVLFRVPIIKKTAQKIVFGEVLVPDTTDAQGHIYSEEEVEKAAHYWMKEFQQLGEMHSKMLAEKQALVLESYVAPVEFTMGSRVVKKGTWLLKLYVEDDDLWEKIDEGSYTGFSIQGLADAETLDED